MDKLVAGKPWHTPVAIAIHSSHMRSVSNTREAAGQLLYDWPTSGRTARLHALKICSEVFKGHLGPDVARAAFILAARAARMRVA